MKIDQIYTGCLAQGAYYIESDGEAAIIDPLRETNPYIQKAEEENAKIKYIFETHFHADFVSGHVDLASKTGATIVFGPNAHPEYEVHTAKDEEEFILGRLKIRVLHTPGHTLESTCYLLTDEDGKETAIFTGDTLFIGDVGRPDLAAKSDLTQEDLAGLLFDSIRSKIFPLGNEVIVYPGHGAGSACGKNMSAETWDTLGHQKKSNYALREDMTREEFIKEVTEGILPPPQYFEKNVMLNKSGYENIDEIIKMGNRPLELEEFRKLAIRNSTLILDTRKRGDFVDGFIPDSLFVGLEGTFAPWVGALISDLKRPILFLADEGTEEEVVIRLARVGYDNTVGYLKGGIETWINAGLPVETIQCMSPEEVESDLRLGKDINLLDVRRPTEYEAEHLENAVSKPLDFIRENMDSLDPASTYHIYCAGGYRSVIEASILHSHGFKNLINITGGYAQLKNTSIPKTEFVCQSGNS